MEIVDDGEISSVPAPRLPASSGQESLKPIYSYRSSATAKGFDDSDKDSSGNDSDDENCHIRPAKRFCSPLDKIRSPVVMTQAPYPSIAEEVSDSNKPTKKKKEAEQHLGQRSGRTDTDGDDRDRGPKEADGGQECGELRL